MCLPWMRQVARTYADRRGDVRPRNERIHEPANHAAVDLGYRQEWRLILSFDAETKGISQPPVTPKFFARKKASSRSTLVVSAQ